MNVIVACEFSGRVRDAFIAAGHEATSCDLLPSDREGPHHQGDILAFLDAHAGEFDLMVAHPPCTYLCGSGERWMKNNPDRQQKRIEAVAFVRRLLSYPIPRIALENPVGHLSTALRKPDQIIQPYDFGEDASKATCLWLKNLPPLVPTRRIPPRMVNGKPRWANQTDGGGNRLPPSPDRWKRRSITYQGIAEAMAAQWG